MIQARSQTKSSTKSINNPKSIDFANDNFGVFCSNYFLNCFLNQFSNYFPLANFKNSPSSAQSSSSPAFSNSNLGLRHFVPEPFISNYASSLLFALLQDDSRLPLRRIAALAPEGVLAKISR